MDGTERQNVRLGWDGPNVSGTGFLLITAQGSNLGTQLVRALLVAPGKGDGKGELEFLKLVITFFLGMAA